MGLYGKILDCIGAAIVLYVGGDGLLCWSGWSSTLVGRVAMAAAVGFSCPGLSWGSHGTLMGLSWDSHESHGADMELSWGLRGNSDGGVIGLLCGFHTPPDVGCMGCRYVGCIFGVAPLWG